GATCGIFPVDDETLRYLRLTGRSEEQVALVEAYCKAQGLFHTADTPAAAYSDTLELNLRAVEPSLAGPRRPQDRVALKDAKASCQAALPTLRAPTPNGAEGQTSGLDGAAVGQTSGLDHGAIVIAAITSCTNTSNPALMVGAGLLAKKAGERGLAPP